MKGRSRHDPSATARSARRHNAQIRDGALDSSGHQLKQAVRGAAAGGQTPLITLAPGQVASAEITGNTASCTKLTTIAAFLVTAPDQRTSVRLAGSHVMCLNSLGVNPLERGDAGGLPL